jgi:DNA-binding helix-turn-helix protein
MDRLSNNIKSLRKSMGETQEDLAYSLDLNSKSAIANWESGENRPSPDNIKRLADHYRVTVDQLLNDDLCINFSVIDFLSSLNDNETYDFLHSFVCLFPIVNFKDEDELYPRLVDAKIFHKKFHECVKNKDETSFDYLEKAMKIYSEFEHNADCISAKANVLGILLFMTLYIKNFTEFEGLDTILEIKNENKRKKEIKRFISEDYLCKNVDISDTLRSILSEDYYKDILELITVLKGNKRLFQLGDYYHCLIYIFDVVDNELSTGMNQQIGLALLSDLSLMKNRQVGRIKSFFKKTVKVQER